MAQMPGLEQVILVTDLLLTRQCGSTFRSRPDIHFAVHQVARFSHAPKKSHGAAVKRIVRYLIGTADKGISFQPNLSQGLDCWVDADFAGLYGYEDDQDQQDHRKHTPVPARHRIQARQSGSRSLLRRRTARPA